MRYNHIDKSTFHSMAMLKYFLFILTLGVAIITANAQNRPDSNIIKATTTLKAIYKFYTAPGNKLLRENYPYDNKYTPDYLAANPGTTVPNAYAYLWPYSGTFSATTALLEATGDKQYKKLLDEKVLPGLEQYFDVKRKPDGYASYINTAAASDRFYDDNIWLGIDFADLYRITQHKRHLDKANAIWKFVLSGYDEKLGGGIYWCEQKKESKNTCSNAPAAVMAFKLFGVTGDSSYLRTGQNIYEWTKTNLQDTTDGLYFDNISLSGKIATRKYAYNSGQMLQASVMLYKITGKKEFLKEAERIAAAAADFFFRKESSGCLKFRDANIWFNAIMLRGFADLYGITGDDIYIAKFHETLDCYYRERRSQDGLFFSGGQPKWLLTQAAFVEMYARLAFLRK